MLLYDNIEKNIMNVHVTFFIYNVCVKVCEMHVFRAVIHVIVSFSKQNSVNVESQLYECSTTENVHRITLRL